MSREIKCPHCGAGVFDLAGKSVPQIPAIWNTKTGKCIACPYGLPGDRIWVKEGWAVAKGWDGLKPSDILATSQIWRAADGLKRDWAGRTRSCLHMPRWASRLTLEIVSIRAERLSQINEEDAMSEGARDYILSLGYRSGDNFINEACRMTKRINPNARVCSTLGQFAAMWERINGKRRGCAWADNPWCWRIEFKRLEQAQ